MVDRHEHIPSVLILLLFVVPELFLEWVEFREAEDIAKEPRVYVVCVSRVDQRRQVIAAGATAGSMPAVGVFAWIVRVALVGLLSEGRHVPRRTLADEW